MILPLSPRSQLPYRASETTSRLAASNSSMDAPYRQQPDNKVELVVARPRRRIRVWHALVVAAGCIAMVLIGIVGGPGAMIGPFVLVAAILAVDTSDDAWNELAALPFPIEHDHRGEGRVVAVTVHLCERADVETAVRALPAGIVARVDARAITLTGKLDSVQRLADLATTWAVAVHAAYGVDGVRVTWVQDPT
jgi:hypothetical protein